MRSGASPLDLLVEADWKTLSPEDRKGAWLRSSLGSWTLRKRELRELTVLELRHPG